MNRILFIFLPSMFFFFSCAEKRKDADPSIMAMLDSIYLLADYDSRSAMALVDSIDYSTFSGEELAYFNLLRVRVQDKNLFVYSETLPSDSLAKEAWNYYMTYGNEKMKVEAIYYLGRALYKHGDSFKALDYFRNAADLAKDKSTISNERKFAIHSQISEILRLHGTSDLALKEYKEAMLFLDNDTTSRKYIHALFDLSNCYYETNRKDSSTRVFYRALDLVEQTDEWKYFSESILKMVDHYLVWDEAEYSANIVKKLLEHVPVEELNYVSVGILGDYYLEIGDVNTATPLLRRSYEAAADMDQQTSMCLSLMMVYNNGVNNDSLYKYVNQYLDLERAYWNTNRERIIMEEAYLYKYRKDEVEQVKLENERLRLRWYVAIGLCILLLLFVACGFIYVISKKRQQRLRLKLRQMEYTQALVIRMSDDSIKKFKSVAEGSRDRSILTENDWESIVTLCERNSPGFLSSINKFHDILSLRMVILKKLDFSSREIANITGKSHSTVARKIKDS